MYRVSKSSSQSMHKEHSPSNPIFTITSSKQSKILFLSRKRSPIIQCTCKKSNCNNRYCECFSLSKQCSSLCQCVNCSNIFPSQSIIKTSLSCICKKTYCCKNYCECYRRGIHCTSSCKCIDCHNKLKDSDTVFSSISQETDDITYTSIELKIISIKNNVIINNYKVNNKLNL